jgi:hypothetical protein
MKNKNFQHNADLQEAVRELAHIYNVKTDSDLLATLIGIDSSVKSINEGQVEFAMNQFETEELVKHILDVQNGGSFLNEFEINVDNFLSGDVDSDISNKVNGHPKRLFTITHESESSTKKYISTKKISDVLNDKSEINRNISAPTKDQPSIGVVQFHSMALNYCQRNTGIAAVFLSSIPSTELSKCVPYFDMQIISSANSFETEQGERNNPSGIGLVKFLSRDITDNETSNFLRRASVFGGDENGNNVEENKYAFAGMELFTMPQTANYVGEKYRDLDVFDTSNDRRNVIDSKRPFMTVKSFDVQVSPGRGLMKSTRATMQLTLHDRSRLSDITELVTPGKLNQVEILVEYGWSHPRPDTPYGKLLNAARIINKYRVSATSYTFTPAGEMDISLTMFVKGRSELAFGMVTDRYIRHDMDELDKILREIQNIKKKITNVPTFAQIAETDILGKMNSANSVLSLDQKVLNEVRKLSIKLGNDAKEINNVNKKETLNNMSDKLESAFEKTSSLKTKLVSAKNKLKRSISLGDDPFLKDKKYRNSPKTSTHVSFAKICLNFIAKNLAMSNSFDEVQLIFYPMNAYSSYCRDDDVGSFPINKTNFKKFFDKRLETNSTMTIMQFIGFMNKLFFSNLASDAYGFGSVYTRSKDGAAELKSKSSNASNATDRVLNAAYGSDNAELRFKKPRIQLVMETVPHVANKNTSICRLHLFDAAANSYTSYYDVYRATIAANVSTFNKQAIDKEHSHIKDSQDTQRSVKGDHGEIYAQSANKIFNNPIFSNFFKTTKINTSEGEKEVLYVNGGPNKIRSFLAYNMPTIKYGTEASGVINANLATSTDPTLQMIHMKKQFQKNAHAPDADADDGIPLKILRTTLDMECFGCPFIFFGQQFFVDFATNTTADDVYAISGMSHKITPGSFTTNIKMHPMQKEGLFESITRTTNKLLNEIQITASEIAEED